MTELGIKTEPTFTNPDGKEYPVMFNWTTNRGSEIKKFCVRIVNSNNERLEYMAINPTTQKEVRLGTTQWALIYSSLLNKEPPADLNRRVSLYYKIREHKAMELVAKGNTIYSPFDEPEQIAA